MFLLKNLIRKSSGVHGDLIITSGNTVTLPAGSYRDYTKIDIQLGGTLVIDGSAGGAITEICCRRTCNISGNIIANNLPTTGGSWNKTTQNPFVSEAISYSVAQANGGAGGAGGNYQGFVYIDPDWVIQTSYGGAGGAASGTGLGGGGGGGSSGNTGTPYPAGSAGGTAGGNGLGPNPGIGNTTLLVGFENGANGLPAGGIGYVKGGNGGGSGGGTSGQQTYADPGGGSGAGGGFRGKNGLGFYLISRQVPTGSGKIYCGAGGIIGGRDPMIGWNGGVGGNGQATSGGAGGGGGGGGGAGGSGGKVWIRYPGTATVSYFSTYATINSLTVYFGGALGGSGGAHGGDYNAGGATNGVAGSLGNNGTASITAL